MPTNRYLQATAISFGSVTLGKTRPRVVLPSGQWRPRLAGRKRHRWWRPASYLALMTMGFGKNHDIDASQKSAFSRCGPIGEKPVRNSLGRWPAYRPACHIKRVGLLSLMNHLVDMCRSLTQSAAGCIPAFIIAAGMERSLTPSSAWSFQLLRRNWRRNQIRRCRIQA